MNKVTTKTFQQTKQLSRSSLMSYPPAHSDWAQFIAEITFSGLKPSDPGIILLTGEEKPIPSQADWNLTRLPHEDQKTKTTLWDLTSIPRMSTCAIGAIIHMMVAAMPNNQSFVNVGVWHGFTFFCGMAGNREKRCIGIDHFGEFGGPRDAFMERFDQRRSSNHLFYDMDYRDYFCDHHEGTIGLYIYDGNHSREHQKEALQIAEPHFADDCLLLVDDLNWNEVVQGTNDFLHQSSANYRILAHIKTAHNKHPTYWNGLLVLQREHR